MALTKINARMARAMALKSKRRRKLVFVPSKQLLHPRLVHQARKRRPFQLPTKETSNPQALDPSNMSSSPEADSSPSPSPSPSPPPPDDLQSSFLKLLPHPSPPGSGESSAADRSTTLDSARIALQKLLADPIRFVPATEITMATEIRIPPKRLKQENRTKRQLERFSHINGISKKFPNSIKRLGAVGMVNPHNWCYRRGVLQSLVNLPVFLNWIERHKPGGPFCDNRRRAGSPCIACSLRKLCEAYWNPGRTTNSVDQATAFFDDVVNKLGREPSNSPWPPESLYGLGGGRKRKGVDKSQQCAGEFAGWIFQQLEEREVMPKEETNALFMLELKWCWSCRKCAHEHSSNVESNYQIHVSLSEPRPNLDLESYLDHYFTSKVDVTCERCRTKQGNTRRGRIVDGPEVLFVQLKRVVMDYYRGCPVKNSKPCPFPLYLDLSKHALSAQLRSKGNLRYRLSSVVQHAGGAGSGHYTAKVVSPLGAQLLDDDSPAMKVSVERLLKPKDAGFDPYLLTYVRVRAGEEHGQ